MRSPLHNDVLLVLYLKFVLSLQLTTKPTFYPYCTTKTICKQVCSCEVAPGCNILPMDENFRQSVLKFHNQLRDSQSKMNPLPSGLSVLQYDSELEEVSTCWAVACRNEYSECFITTKYSETTQSVTQLLLEVGQKPNVFMWLQAMEDWVDLVGTESERIIEKLPFGQESEHLNNYAQLMTDRVLSIGCSWSINETSNLLNLVCTYGPRGPLQGEAVYNTGNPCSSCPYGYSCNKKEPFRLLCKFEGYPMATTRVLNNDLWKFSENRGVAPFYISSAVGLTSNFMDEQTNKYQGRQGVDEETESLEDIYNDLALPELTSSGRTDSVEPRAGERDPWDFTNSANEMTHFHCFLISSFACYIVNIIA